LVCIMQCSGSTFGYLYKSTNSGTNFTVAVTGNSANGTNYMGYSTSGTDNSGQGNYDMVLAISPTDANEIHLGGIQTWKSTNGGTSFVCTTSWSLPNSLGYCHPDMHAMEYVGNTLYTGSDGGIYKSIDKADNFIDLTSGMSIRMIYRMGCSATDPNVIAVGAQDNGCSIKKSTGWIDWLGADGMESAVDPNNANIIYGATQSGSFSKTTNQGTSQSALNTPESNGNWITPFAIDKSSAIYVGYIELYKSTNGGTNWTTISNFGGSSKMDNITVAPSNSSYIYVSKGTSINRTTNGGTSWTSIATGLGGATIARIAVHNSSPNKVAVITTNSNVYTSTDGGTTWTSITGNLPAAGGVCIIYDNATTAGLYVGMNSGVYYRDNTMSAWVPYMTNLPKVKVNDLEIQYSVNKVRAATYGRGVWESDLYSVATSIQKEPSFITTLKAFPNPNDGHFNLEMNIAETNNYVIEIYNVLGELVYDESLIGFKGDYKKSFDISSYGKGVYTLSVTNSENKNIKKLIVY
ncbi:MAG: T9SS type A sorting domain-containing protein, partial [Bacteroidetes bacterium]|nr:T9SS type A sorting domain-containing protein [Bacteroidota bacterium]